MQLHTCVAGTSSTEGQARDEGDSTAISPELVAGQPRQPAATRADLAGEAGCHPAGFRLWFLYLLDLLAPAQKFELSTSTSSSPITSLKQPLKWIVAR